MTDHNEGVEVVLGATTYPARVTPLRTGGRRDVEVAPHDDNLPAAMVATDIVTQLRRFFDALEAEAQSYRGDPVALSQALAKLEALSADVRYARDSVKALAATALNEQRVRRLTVHGIVTVEGGTEVKRSEWRHHELLVEVLRRLDLMFVNSDTGEVLTGDAAASLLETVMRPEWKMTGLRGVGLEPDDYCTVATGEDGRPQRTPSVRIVDNVVRRNG